MPLIQCVECGREISNEAMSCPACGKVTDTGKTLAGKTRYILITQCVVSGIVIGGYTGYSASPISPMFGQVPIIHAITNGTFLKGMDMTVVSYVKESFNCLMYGSIGGLSLGYLVARFLTNILRI